MPNLDERRCSDYADSPRSAWPASWWRAVRLSACWLTVLPFSWQSAAGHTRVSAIVGGLQVCTSEEVKSDLVWKFRNKWKFIFSKQNLPLVHRVPPIESTIGAHDRLIIFGHPILGAAGPHSSASIGCKTLQKSKAIVSDWIEWFAASLRKQSSLLLGIWGDPIKEIEQSRTLKNSFISQNDTHRFRGEK